MSEENYFEKDLVNAIQNKVLEEIKKGSFISFDRQWKSQLPSSLLKDAWESVDYEAIKREMAKTIEKMLAEKIINMLATEVSTDLKSLLSIPERREEIRSVARRHLKHLVGEA